MSCGAAIKRISAESEDDRVLPRIGSALAQFIAPITSSGARGQNSVRNKTKSHLDAQPEKKEDSKKHHTDKHEDKHPEQKTPQHSPSELENNSSQSLATTFLQIFSLFQIKNNFLLRLLGADAYARSTRSQKKGSKFKKGIMLDEKIE